MNKKDYQFFINHSDEKIQQIAILNRKLSKVLLDIGPGEGTITLALKQKFEKIDVVEKKKEYCSNLEKKDIVCYNCSFEDFNTDTRYDVILASHLLTYIDNKEEAIAKMYKLLKVGGKIFLFTMTYDNLMKTIKEKIHPNTQNRTDIQVQDIVKKYSVYERELIPINITTKTPQEMIKIIKFLSEKRVEMWKKNKDKIRNIIKRTSINNGYKLNYYNVLYTIYKI